MKLLALADIHGEEQALDRLRVVTQRKDYDAVIICGDLTTRGPSSYAEELLDFLPKRSFVILGNMDPPELGELVAAKGFDIHGKRKKLGEWNVIGISGSNPTPFGTPNEVPEEEIERLLRDARVDEYTILVTHAPPYGYFDDVGKGLHVGSKAVRRIIEERKPILNICGHVHEHTGQEMLGETLVVKLPLAQQLQAAEITINDEIKVNFISF